ncbi:hypothetical protein D9M68_432000 [compost metagenome]
MATAASPLRASPTRARISSTPSQVGMAALARVNSAAAISDTTITGLRPRASDSGPVTSRPRASMAVETDSARLLWAAEMEKSLDSTGIIGWMQYNRAKVAKPPENSAREVRMNCGVPFLI